MLLRLGLMLTVLSGCSSHCQQLCENMAEFAESECDIKVAGSQVDDCIAEFEEPSEAEEEACETYQDIQNEAGWTCELVEKYFTDESNETE